MFLAVPETFINIHDYLATHDFVCRGFVLSGLWFWDSPMLTRELANSFYPYFIFIQLLVLKTYFPSFIYVAVMKHPDKMQLRGERGYFFFYNSKLQPMPVVMSVTVAETWENCSHHIYSQEQRKRARARASERARERENENGCMHAHLFPCLY